MSFFNSLQQIVSSGVANLSLSPKRFSFSKESGGEGGSGADESGGTQQQQQQSQQQQTQQQQQQAGGRSASIPGFPRVVPPPGPVTRRRTLEGSVHRPHHQRGASFRQASAPAATAPHHHLHHHPQPRQPLAFCRRRLSWPEVDQQATSGFEVNAPMPKSESLLYVPSGRNTHGFKVRRKRPGKYLQSMRRSRPPSSCHANQKSTLDCIDVPLEVFRRQARIPNGGAISSYRNTQSWPPVPAQPLTYVLNASQFGRKCPQANTDKELVELMTGTGDIEDCLHLNVYTTQLPGKCNSLHPVMFYIHGGSFRVGSSHDFRPDYLLEKDVVLVVIQYRLGPLGFLSLQNEDISGNMGLLDQLLALKWVNKYISHFCGNHKQVTIFGQSSGAAAVSLMLASPLTRNADLFHRVIVQSGSGLCEWALDDDPEQHARSIAILAKCPSNSTNEEIALCLRKLTPYQLFIAHADYLVGVLLTEGRAVGGNNGGNHAIVQMAGPHKFLVEDPRVSYANGDFLKIPMMIGVTKHEGTFFVGNIYDFILDRLNATNNTDFLTSTFLQAVLKFSGIVDPTGAITDIFESKFFQREEVGNFTAMIPGLVDICGDTLVKSCTFKTARFNNDQDTYLYSFNYKGHLTKFGYGEEANYPFSGGVAHSDDLIYLFPHGNGTLNDGEMFISRTMVELWTNFAIYGTPKPAHGVKHWPPMSSYYGPYLRIDKEASVQQNFLSEYYITITEGLNSLETGKNECNSGNTYLFVYITLLYLLLRVL